MFFDLLGGCYYDYCYNEEGIRKKKWYRRHGYDETMTEKQKNEIKWFKKVDIERGGWRFLVLKESTALLLAVVTIGISFIHQFVISKNNYVDEISDVSYTHIRAHYTRHDLVCRHLL